MARGIYLATPVETLFPPALKVAHPLEGHEGQQEHPTPCHLPVTSRNNIGHRGDEKRPNEGVVG